MLKPQSRTVPALLAEMVARDPAQTAIVGGGVRLSYTEFTDAVRTAARALTALGIGAGDRVGLLLGNRPEWLIVDFAAMTLGAIAVGLNTWATAHELAYQLEHAGVKLLLIEPRFRASDSVALVHQARSLAGAWLGGERGALLLQSSGVGNCVNAIASITQACRLPLLMLVTMRGEWGEGNPWQMPMGRAVQPVLEILGARCTVVEHAEDVEATVTAQTSMTFAAGIVTAILLSQRLIGAKTFQ